MSSRADDVVVIGAGISGLACGLELAKAGRQLKILEASGRPGGRVKTDNVDGFLLDRGFQIFLTAYPEAKKILDYEELDFHTFTPGALVRYKNKFHALCDPWKNPGKAISTMVAPVGTPADKVRIASLRTRTGLMDMDKIFSQPDVTTLSALKDMGFTDSMLETFLRPFLSGIFLEKELDTSKRFFDFVFRMLAHGDNVLPANGMEAIPRQMVDKLPENSIRVNCKVSSIKGDKVFLESGEIIECDNIIIATEETTTRKLLGIPGSSKFNSQTTIYFSSDTAPFAEQMIAINGEPDGFVTNLSVQSNIAPSYAPDGKSLISVSVVGNAYSERELEERARKELQSWFDDRVNTWQLLKVYEVNYSLPDQSPEANKERRDWIGKVGDLTLAGDFMETGSINGAMLAGKKAARKILQSSLAIAK